MTHPAVSFLFFVLQSSSGWILISINWSFIFYFFLMIYRYIEVSTLLLTISLVMEADEVENEWIWCSAKLTDKFLVQKVQINVMYSRRSCSIQTSWWIVTCYLANKIDNVNLFSWHPDSLSSIFLWSMELSWLKRIQSPLSSRHYSSCPSSMWIWNRPLPMKIILLNCSFFYNKIPSRKSFPLQSYWDIRFFLYVNHMPTDNLLSLNVRV